MSKFDFDLITIGAGSGGVRASRLSAGYGGRVALIEESRVGGTCVFRGCVPKKLLVYGAHYAEHIEDAAGFGWTIKDSSHDWGNLIAAKDKELQRLEELYCRMLSESGVSLIEGRGVLIDPHTVEVGGQYYTAEKILVSVGGWPLIPNVPGREHIITSNEAMDLSELPRSILIVGGGYIALEFASIFNALGSQVDIVIRASSVLRGFDNDVCNTVSQELERKGIRINSDCLVRSIEKTSDGLSVVIDSGKEIVVEKVMYATGRLPNTKGLGLDSAGVELGDKGEVIVDEWNRSSIDSIFAVGDVTDRVNLTPVAINEGRVFAETFFNGKQLILDYKNIASAVFTQPAVGCVGLTEEQANDKYSVSVFLVDFKHMKHTLSGRDERVMMKLIVDKDNDRVLGCHMVGNDSPEIIQGLAVALKCGATKAHFDATIGIHPTAAEEFVTMRDVTRG